MIVRVRDLVSGLLLFPLALSGFALGALLWSAATSLFASPAADAPPTMRADHGDSLLVTLIVLSIGLVITLSVPAAYFAATFLKMRSDPDHRYFGELSQPVFIGLSLFVYLGSLVLGFVLLIAFS